MTRRSTRRSVSVKGLTYQRIKAWCDRNNWKVAAFFEHIADEVLSRPGGEPAHTKLQPRDPLPLEVRPGPTPVNLDFPTAPFSGGGLKTWQT